MAQQKKEYTILAAPSKFDLMAALFHGSNGESQPLVKFTVRERIPGSTNLTGPTIIVQASINGVMREDGSGESWIIEGYVKCSSMPRSVGFKGWFRTTDRHGHMTY